VCPGREPKESIEDEGDVLYEVECEWEWDERVRVRDNSAGLSDEEELLLPNKLRKYDVIMKCPRWGWGAKS
jgi:hypothetical protein